MSNESTATGTLAPLAFFLVAAGGGVIGHDYARWLTVDPVVGAIAGGLVSLVIVRILFELYADPQHKIRDALSAIGAIAGIFVGGDAGSAPSGDMTGWLIGAVIGGAIGAWMGQMLAAAVSMLALVLLLLSHGPLGAIVKAVMLNGGS